MSIAHELILNDNELDPALQGLPIETVGQADPLNPDYSLGFPHVLYHGTGQEEFAFNDRQTNRTAFQGTGARTGPGLYAASKNTSANFGNGTIVELIPKDARLIDFNAPEMDDPLSAAFRQSYLEDYRKNAVGRVEALFPADDPQAIRSVWQALKQAGGLVTIAQVKAVSDRYKAQRPVYTGSGIAVGGWRMPEEVAAQINMARLMQDRPDVSLRDIFSAHDTINDGKPPVDRTIIGFTINPMIDFLRSKRVDGAITAQRFPNGQGGEEHGVVLWKLDNVGDKETWQRRAQRRTAALGGVAVTSNLGGNTVTHNGDDLRSLQGAPVLDARTAHRIDTIVQAKGNLAPAARMTKIAQALRDYGTLDPLKVVRNLANSSPELSAMLSAGAPSGKGPKLHERMQASLGVFESRFAPQIKDVKERQLLRMALVLRNIGRTNAQVLNPDNAEAQQKTNTEIARSLLRGIDDAVLSREDKIFVSALVNQDIIAKRMRDETDDATAHQEYLNLKQKLPSQYHGMLSHGLESLYTCGVAALSSKAEFTTAEGKPGVPSARNDSKLTYDPNGRLRLQAADRKPIAVIIA